jgi:very-short-patch-repair endonuclease
MMGIMAFVGKTKEYLLHLEAKEETMHFAQSLRKKMTRAEQALWAELKGRKFLNLKFRRQHPIHWYIADFYCHEKRLVIEVDGRIHERDHVKEHDENRSAELAGFGIHVLRFSNEQVLSSIHDVLREIQSFLIKVNLLGSPSSPGEGA